MNNIFHDINVFYLKHIQFLKFSGVYLDSSLYKTIEKIEHELKNRHYLLFIHDRKKLPSSIVKTSSSLLKRTNYFIPVSCYLLSKHSFLFIYLITIANGQKTQNMN